MGVATWSLPFAYDSGGTSMKQMAKKVWKALDCLVMGGHIEDMGKRIEVHFFALNNNVLAKFPQFVRNPYIVEIAPHHGFPIISKL